MLFVSTPEVGVFTRFRMVFYSVSAEMCHNMMHLIEIWTVIIKRLGSQPKRKYTKNCSSKQCHAWSPIAKKRDQGQCRLAKAISRRQRIVPQMDSSERNHLEKNDSSQVGVFSHQHSANRSLDRKSRDEEVLPKWSRAHALKQRLFTRLDSHAMNFVNISL